MDKVIDLEEETPEDQVLRLERRIAELEQRLELYEKPSDAALYYAVKRKQNEMAILLNKTTVETAMAGENKSFERMRYIWNDSKDLVVNTKLLGEIVGITGDEIRDTSRPGAFLDNKAT